MTYDRRTDGPHRSEEHDDIISVVLERLEERGAAPILEHGPENPVSLAYHIQGLCTEHCADMYGSKYAEYGPDWDEVLLDIIALCMKQYQKVLEEYGFDKPIRAASAPST